MPLFGESAAGISALGLIILLSASCGPGSSGTDQKSQPDAISSATMTDQDGLYHESVEELTYLHGVSESEVMEILGEPVLEDSLMLHCGETLPEFYIEVHNTYHPDSSFTEGVIIRHLQWDYAGFSKALFLHLPAGSDQWIVLESVRWVDGVDF